MSPRAGALWLLALLTCAGFWPGSADAAAVVTVCPTGGAHATIQAGVTAAVAGDTVQVCASTTPFAEQVVITKSVKLVGAGSAATTITLPAAPTGTQDVITVDGAGVDVEISGFTITGFVSPNDCPGLLSGVFVRGGANANIHDNLITHLRADPLGGCQKGIGIRVGRSQLNTSGTATITNNTISDIQKGGIVVDHTGSAATITRNTVTGSGPTGAIAQNGIQISRSAAASVIGNRISGHQYTGTPVVLSAGLLLFDKLGETTVSGNTLSANDNGISVGSVVPTGGSVRVSKNTVSGGAYGILLADTTTATLIEENTVSGFSTVGIEVGSRPNENVLRGNKVSGADAGAADQFDCRDRSLGNKSNGTANTWTDNTGAKALPDGICSPAAAPEPPPVVIDTPVVIVLPPASPGDPTPPAQPAGPLAEAAADEIITKMEDKQIQSCLIELRSRGPQKIIVARGVARAPAGGRGQMVIKLDTQPKGEQLLNEQFGGVVVDVRAFCRTAANEARFGVKSARAVLAIERVVTTPGSWVPDQPVLTPIGLSFVAGLERRMVAIVGIRCDGYTATWPPSPVEPMLLSRQRAQRVCAQLKQGGGFSAKPRLVPHGNAGPIATNETEAGRSVNRRVVITFVHRVAERTRSARV